MENEAIKYQIKGIELIHKSMFPATSEVIVNMFFFEIQVEMRVSSEKKFVIPIVTIKIKDANNNIELGSLGVSCLFEIENFEKHITLDKVGLFVIPPSLENALSPIAVSTARGVMFSEFRGTHLNGAIMPIVYLSRLPKNENP